ncbi:MAG: hypothetical protein ACOH10_00880 [Rhodoglobus sp.]
MKSAFTVERKHVVFCDESLKLFEVDECWSHFTDQVFKFAMQGVHDASLR